ncbi:hypothetical protein ACWKSP_10595 [Micromonosporaceae bacterium Da 78-11]
MSADLERRYTRLLRLYPAGYRRARGAELLATLLESAEQGRQRPAAREVGALVLGALRVHAGWDRRQRWSVAFRAAALMLLVHGLASAAVSVGLDFWYAGPSLYSRDKLVITLLASVLGAYALSATLRARYVSAAATAAAAFLVTQAVAWQGPAFNSFLGFPLAVVLLVSLLRLRPAPATGLVRYAPVLPLLLVLADQGLSQLFPDVAGILQRGVLLALCVGGLVWLAVDERLAMALGLLLFNSLVVQVAFILQTGLPGLAGTTELLAVAGFMPALLLLSSGAIARRRARI